MSYASWHSRISRRKGARVAAGIALASALACGPGGAEERSTSEPTSPAPVLDALFQEGRSHLALTALVDRIELDAEENIRGIELHRDADTSHHLVAVRDRETPHRHDLSALTVVVLEGGGMMRIGDEERPAPAGSILYVPRATPHAFRNTADAPSIAYVVFAPPSVPDDRPPAD